MEKISQSEHNTILAALRYYQGALMLPFVMPKKFNDIATDGDVKALDDKEIDDLCIRINTKDLMLAEQYVASK